MALYIYIHKLQYVYLATVFIYKHNHIDWMCAKGTSWLIFCGNPKSYVAVMKAPLTIKGEITVGFFLKCCSSICISLIMVMIMLQSADSFPSILICAMQHQCRVITGQENEVWSIIYSALTLSKVLILYWIQYASKNTISTFDTKRTKVLKQIRHIQTDTIDVLFKAVHGICETN